MTFDEWAARWPAAAAELETVFAAMPWNDAEGSGKSEAWAQQRVRFQVAHQGGMAWRNNVGATPAKCKACGEPQQPTRYGLANDSMRLNQKIKSSDLILAIPRIIRPQDVGKRIAQFGSAECKPPGWKYSGTERERAQAAWLTLINKLGGYATFTTGDIQL